MSAEVGAVKYKVELDDSGLDQEVSKTESSLASKLGKAAGGVGKAALGAFSVGAAAVTGLTTSIVNGAKATAAYGDNVDKMSQKIGISAEAFQEWDYVLGQNGADISILESGMKTLSSAVADAGSGTKSAQEKFKKLGLSFEALGKMSQEDIFSTVIASLQEMPDGAERTALAADLLGKSAMELGPLLNQTAEDTAALKQQAHDLGAVMSDEAVKDSAAFTDSMDNLSHAVDGAKNQLASSLLPALTDITNGFAGMIAGSEGAVDQVISGFDSLAASLTDAIPMVVELVTGLVESIATVAPEIIKTLADAILSSIPELLPIATDLILQLAQMLIEMAPQLIEVGLQVILQLALGIADALPDLIPTIVDVVLQIVETLIDNVDLLIDAAIALILGLAEGIINALPVLLEKAPEIVLKLMMAIVENAPKILEAAIKLIFMLVKGIGENLPKVVQAAWGIVKAVIQGIGEWISKLPENGKKIVSEIYNGIKSLNPLQWGKDLIHNFVSGITGSIQAVKDAVGRVAGAVKDFLGFSEPDEGPLSNFHTFAPDMVDLFAKGMEDNKNKLADASADMAGSIAMGFTSDINYNVPDLAGYASDLSASITGTGSSRIEVPVILDGREIARASAVYMGEQLAWEAR